MKPDRIAVNTIVFVQEMRQAEKRQAEYFAPLARMGVPAVEVRRELFEDPQKEAGETGRAAREHGLQVFYSAPVNLYGQGKLDTGRMAELAREAEALGAGRVKVTLGGCEGVSREDAAWLERTFGAAGMVLSLENDQTPANGRAEPLRRFMGWCGERGLRCADLTFDAGNWLYTGEDPLACAQALGEWAGMFHLKDVAAGPPPAACLLDEGDVPWRALLGVLPAAAPVVLEYPCGPQPLPVLQREVDKLRAALVSADLA